MHTYKLKKYHFIDSFNLTKFVNLNRDISLIWRSKYAEEDINNIIKIANYCRKYKRKFYLANNFKLAIKLNLDGVYISANNKSIRHNSYILKKKFKILGSAHNQYEIDNKKNQKVKELFLSPIFKKKGVMPIGLYKIKNLFDLFSGPKIALGGINKKNIRLLKLSKFNGFAAIEYFDLKKKRPQIIEAFLK